MNILMCTNTYAPHVGGVARSVEQFSAEFRAKGHRVLVIAPEFPNLPVHEEDVIRIAALQQFNGSDFSLPLPISGTVMAAVEAFRPNIVHSHHPFLLGDAALRISAALDIPIVFTHHTQYEKYTHYVPGDSEVLKRFVIQLAAGYCNLCDAVIAPSNSIVKRLKSQGVEVELHEVPTGVDLSVFGRGDGKALRNHAKIPTEAFVVGHVGRLAREKGLDFLAQAVAKFLSQRSDTYFLVAGNGPAEDAIRSTFDDADLRGRLKMLGSLSRCELPNVYAAMDVFAFSSQSETQGMVLTEAMAEGVPVVAVDASGVREVVEDQRNGRLLLDENVDAFVSNLCWICDLSKEEKRAMSRAARETAERMSLTNTAEQLLKLYEQLILQRRIEPANTMWSDALRRFDEEWKIWTNRAGALSTAIIRNDS